MDERTFTRELHEINDKIIAMAAKGSPPGQQDIRSYIPVVPLSDKPVVRDPRPDEVIAGLNELKSYINKTEGLLYGQTPVNSSQQSISTVPSHARESTQLANSDFGQSNLTLPAGPIFWQLFNTLRSDVQGLEGRVTSVEHKVSDLQDAVDDLTPAQFTPASSIASDNSKNVYLGHGQRQSYEPVTPAACTHQTRPQDNLPVGSSEGMAYRDKELARSDELLAAVSLQYKELEQKYSDRVDEIKELETHNEGLANRLSSVCKNLVDKYRELERDRARLEKAEQTVKAQRRHLKDQDDKYADERAYSQRMESHLDKTKADLEQSRACARAWQTYAQEVHDRRSDEVGARDDMLQQLQAFCENKDVLAAEREHIIARGADLLHERDDEIEHLTRKLRGLEEHVESRRRQKAEMLRKMQQTSDDFADMRERMRWVCQVPKLAGNREEEVQELGNRLDYVYQLAERVHNPKLKELIRSPSSSDKAKARAEDEQTGRRLENRVATADAYPSAPLGYSSPSEHGAFKRLTRGSRLPRREGTTRARYSQTETTPPSPQLPQNRFHEPASEEEIQVERSSSSKRDMIRAAAVEAEQKLQHMSQDKAKFHPADHENKVMLPNVNTPALPQRRKSFHARSSIEERDRRRARFEGGLQRSDESDRGSDSRKTRHVRSTPDLKSIHGSSIASRGETAHEDKTRGSSSDVSGATSTATKHVPAGTSVQKEIAPKHDPDQEEEERQRRGQEAFWDFLNGGRDFADMARDLEAQEGKGFLGTKKSKEEMQASVETEGEEVGEEWLLTN